MYRDLRTSVVRVLASNGSTAGTAFFCLPRGHLVTCTHVLDVPTGSDRLVRLQFSPEENVEAIDLEATVCWQWSSTPSQDDITILQLVDDMPARAAPLSLGAGKPRLGAPVDAYGYPAHNPEFGMPGQAEFVGMTRELTTGAEVYVVRGDSIARGFSGGPCVLRETGEVLGVVTALTTADREGRWPVGCFVTPAESVLRLCPVLTVGTPPAVQALVQLWEKSWEPFQKYIGSPDFRQAMDAEYKFPQLEQISDSFPSSVEPIELLRQQFASNEPKLLVVVGAPGTGKSRLLAELARAVCQTGRDSPLDQQFIPILVTARSYAAARGNSPSEHLAESLRLDGALATTKGLDVVAVETILLDGRYRCLVMIDGADEVASPIGRKQLFKRVATDARAILSEGHLVVLSTRPLYETGSNLLEGLCAFYRLPFLDEADSGRLADGALGHLAENFQRIATSTGLFASLHTPLLLNLAMTLFLRRPTKFPSTIIGIYDEFLELILEGWTDAPATSTEIVEALASAALGSLAPRDSGDRIDEWLDEIDYAVQDAFRSACEGLRADVGKSLCTAQVVINFGLQSSGLMHRQGDAIHWSHLLLRDYLAAMRMSAIATLDERWVQDALNTRYADSLRRESLILFLVKESSAGRAERLLRATCEECDGFPLPLILFVKDCIQRGATFSSDFLERFFCEFEERALEDQRSFGSCESLFSSDYGAFWHLLTLQRISQAQAAILRAVGRADRDRMMSEWPYSDRSRQFAPKTLYSGPLATVPAIFPSDD